MKTEIRVTITTQTKETEFGYLDAETESFVPIKAGASEEELAEFAEWLKASPRLIEAIAMTLEDFKTNVSSDLSDIWERLDRIEKKP